MAAILMEYNQNGTVYFPLIGSGTAAFSTAASGSLVGTNIMISKDGAAFASSTNTGTVVGRGWYRLALTTSELSARQIAIDIAGGTLGTTVEVQGVLIHTFGSASAMYEFELNQGTQGVNVIEWSGTAVTGSAGLPSVGTALTVLTGTITTVTNNVTAATALGTVNANIVAAVSTAMNTTMGSNFTFFFNANGTFADKDQADVGVSAGTFDANLVQILGTAVVATSGTLTNVGTVGSVGSANLTQILGTAVVGTSGTLTNVGTITTVASANLVQILGTAVNGTSGTLTNVGTVNAVADKTGYSLAADQSSVTVGTANFVATGTITTVTNSVTAATALGTVNADVVAVDGSASAATALSLLLAGAEFGSAITGTLTTTAFSTDLTSTIDDFYQDRPLYFISGSLTRQLVEVQGYNGTTKTLTITTASQSPASGDRFVMG